jgi:DNA-binding response OmpR family regulator
MASLLIVEDDSVIHGLMKETLTRAGYTVVSAYSGTEGLLVLKNESIDLVLLDLMLPGLTGEEVIREIRSGSNVPVIAISAKVDTTSKLEMLTNGADDYLTKPFDLEELLARIAIQLRHAEGKNKNNAFLSYQNIKIDEESREVKVGENILHLTGREYDLLLLFITHPQKVFSRANIYETIWREPYFDGDKTINVYISNLRQKLKQAGTEYIKTVWGVGFRFD